MRIWKMVIAMMMVCVLMAGCGATNTAQAPSTAETAAPATASTEQVQTTTSAEQAVEATTQEAEQTEQASATASTEQAPATDAAASAAEARTDEVTEIDATIICEGYTISVVGTTERVDLEFNGGSKDGYKVHSERVIPINGKIKYDDLSDDWKELLMKVDKAWEYINNLK